MTSTLLVVQVILAIFITIAILLQKSSSMGFGAYSGSNDSLFGSKGPANFLTKLTFGLGIAIVLNTLYLGYLYNQENSKSVVDTVKIKIPTPQQTVPAAPKVPAK